MIRIREGVDILELLKRSGFTAYELRKQKIIGEARLQKLRHGELPTMKELNFICWATAYKIGEIIEYKYNGEPWNEDAPDTRPPEARGGADPIHGGEEAEDQAGTMNTTTERNITQNKTEA